MQIVIDIPEGVDVIVDRNKPNEVISEILWQAVKNGTPLPERYEYADGYEDGYEDGYAEGYADGYGTW